MAIFSKLAEWLKSLSPSVQYGLALGLGGILTYFAQAPWRLFFLFFIIVPPILWMLDGAKNVKTSFCLGFFFGFGYFFVGFFWMGNALLISAVPYLAPLTSVGFALVYGFFWGVAFASARRIWSHHHWRFFSLAFFWSITFWVQGFFATGLAWNLPAQSWIFSEALAQNLSWTGIYGASFLMILCSASFAALADRNRYTAYTPPLLALALLSVLWLGGTFRLYHAPLQLTNMHIIIIQPNIAQINKWEPAQRNRIIRKYFQMTDSAIQQAKQNNTIIIWPEAALPVNIERSPILLKALAKLIPDHMLLISGLLRFEHGKVFNSIFVIDHQGKIKQVYDKNHLVPFGEYIPFFSVLNRLNIGQLLGYSGRGISSGSTRAPLTYSPLTYNETLYAIPLICFEIVFPHEIHEIIATYRHIQKPPKWIVNVSNDAWYGMSPGSYQHFDLARLRAIEFGLPVMRAANTGISAAIDPYGRVIAKLNINTQGIIHTPLPEPLPDTLYAVFRDWVFILFLALSAIPIACQTRKNI